MNPELTLALAKVTALLLIGFGLSSLFKNPRLRAILWGGIFVSLPATYALSFELSWFKVIPLVENSLATETSVVIAESITASEPISQNEAMPSDAAPAINSRPPFLWVPVIYLAGVFLALVPLLFSSLKLHLLKKSSATGAPLTFWKELHAGKKRTPALHFTPSPSAPFACGAFKQSVMIPHDSTTWSERRIESTLRHEAAHLSNRDPLTRFAASLVKALFWFHPLVWLAHRQLIAAQEQTCDLEALKSGVCPEDYAEDLLAAISHSDMTPSQALTMARWSQIGSRVRHILNPSVMKPVTLGQIRTLLALVITTQVGLISIGFAEKLEKGQEAPLAIFPSEKELTALAQAEKAMLKFGPLHPKMVELSKLVSPLNVELHEDGSTNWNLKGKPVHFPKGTYPKELERFAKVHHQKVNITPLANADGTQLLKKLAKFEFDKIEFKKSAPHGVAFEFQQPKKKKMVVLNEVVITGQVITPGVISLNKDGRLSVVAAIAKAGGFTRLAHSKKIRIVRKNKNGVSNTLLVDFKKLVAKENPAPMFYLQPGDLVYVPERIF